MLKEFSHQTKYGPNMCL